MLFHNIIVKSQRHLETVKETYWGHMGFALHAVGVLLSAALLLMIHLLVPAWFEFSASNRIMKLADDIRARRDRIAGDR